MTTPTRPPGDPFVYGSRSLSPGREPALILMAVVGPGVALILTFFTGLPAAAVSALNAVAVAAAGVLTAAWIRSDRLAPAVMGLAQALLVLAMAFGWNLSPQQQSAWLTFIGIAVAAYLRTQLTAPITNTNGGANPAPTDTTLDETAVQP